VTEARVHRAAVRQRLQGQPAAGGRQHRGAGRPRAVCRSGSTTRYALRHHRGQESDRGLSGGAAVTGLTRTNVCAEGRRLRRPLALRRPGSGRDLGRFPATATVGGETFLPGRSTRSWPPNKLTLLTTRRRECAGGPSRPAPLRRPSRPARRRPPHRPPHRPPRVTTRPFSAKGKLHDGGRAGPAERGRLPRPTPASRPPAWTRRTAPSSTCSCSALSGKQLPHGRQGDRDRRQDAVGRGPVRHLPVRGRPPPLATARTPLGFHDPVADTGGPPRPCLRGCPTSASKGHGPAERSEAS